MAQREFREWNLFGMHLCSTRFRHIVGLSRNKFKNFKTWVCGGMLEPLQDARSDLARKIRATPQTDHVDSWLNYIYENVAEDLAEAKPGTLAESDGELAEAKPGPTAPPDTVMATTTFGDKAVRYLSGRLEELWEFYQHNCPEFHASKSAFLATYKEKWRGVLVFRRLSQHAQCTTCAMYGAARSMVKTREMRANINKEHQAHLTAIYRDRNVYERMQRLSIEATKVVDSPMEANEKSVLTMTIDGMDQAGLHAPMPRIPTVLHQLGCQLLPHPSQPNACMCYCMAVCCA